MISLSAFILSVDYIRQLISLIKWSNEAGIPTNFRKSGIINIIKNTNTHKIAISKDI